jgi:threonine dehydrogenase-like Zn-dependent dehydrogenase
VPLADGTLVPVPGSGHSDGMLRSLLTLSDVMSTGHHAAVCAGVREGAVIAVVGDGAVGPSGILAAKRLGADGVPHAVELPVKTMFYENIGVRGGGAPARVYIRQLLDDVLEGRIEPGLVLDFETDLDGVGEAYAAMDERRATKSLLRVGSL